MTSFDRPLPTMERARATAPEVRASVAAANATLDATARSLRDRDYPMNRGFK